MGKEYEITFSLPKTTVRVMGKDEDDACMKAIISSVLDGRKFMVHYATSLERKDNENLLEKIERWYLTN